MPPFACSGEQRLTIPAQFGPRPDPIPASPNGHGGPGGSGGMDHMTPARETPLPEPAVLAQAHRTIRFLDPSEGPFRGALVTSPDGPLVRADAESFAGWAGWRYAGSQHIAAPVDIARRMDGHDVLLPWCTERLESYLDRRLRTQSGLPPGEIGTVVVSLLRGLAELGPTAAVEAQGTWWLTEGGRPLFVVGPGQEAASAVSEIVGRLRAECTDKMLARVLDRALDRIGTAAAQRRVPRRLLEEVESGLLEMAAPRPLEEAAEDRQGPPAETGVAGALRRVRVEPVARARLRHRRSRVERLGRPRSTRIVADLLVLRDRVVDRARALIGLQADRPRRPAPERGIGSRRTRVLAVAGAGAVVVLLAGLLWPSERDNPAVGSSGSRPSASPHRAGADSADVDAPSPAPSARTMVAPTDDDPVLALPGLVAQVEECEAQEDRVCTSAVAASPSEVIPLVSGAAGVQDAALIDRYGDIAVLEVPSSSADEEGTEGAITLVLARIEEKWLVRDAYRVADQPR